MINSTMMKTPIIPKNNPLLTDLDNTDPLTKREMKAELWFQKDSFRDFDEDEDEEVDLDKLATTFKEKGKLIGKGLYNEQSSNFIFCWQPTVCCTKPEITVPTPILCFNSLLNSYL